MLVPSSPHPLCSSFFLLWPWLDWESTGYSLTYPPARWMCVPSIPHPAVPRSLTCWVPEFLGSDCSWKIGYLHQTLSLQQHWMHWDTHNISPRTFPFILVLYLLTVKASAQFAGQGSESMGKKLLYLPWFFSMPISQHKILPLSVTKTETQHHHAYQKCEQILGRRLKE